MATATLSAADLLGGASKKGKASSHLMFPTSIEAAANWLIKTKRLDELERSIALDREEIMLVVAPWHEQTCAKRKAHESTVEIATKDGIVRVSFQHRYSKLPMDRQELLCAAVGDKFDRFFKKTVSFKVKKEIADDPAKLEELVLTLAKALGAENFGTLFEVEQTWAPTKVYTEESYQLPVGTKAELKQAGVKQIVAMAAK